MCKMQNSLTLKQALWISTLLLKCYYCGVKGVQGCWFLWLVSSAAVVNGDRSPLLQRRGLPPSLQLLGDTQCLHPFVHLLGSSRYFEGRCYFVSTHRLASEVALCAISTDHSLFPYSCLSCLLISYSYVLATIQVSSRLFYS